MALTPPKVEAVAPRAVSLLLMGGIELDWVALTKGPRAAEARPRRTLVVSDI